MQEKSNRNNSTLHLFFSHDRKKINSKEAEKTSEMKEKSTSVPEAVKCQASTSHGNARLQYKIFSKFKNTNKMESYKCNVHISHNARSELTQFFEFKVMFCDSLKADTFKILHIRRRILVGLVRLWEKIPKLMPSLLQNYNF